MSLQFVDFDADGHQDIITATFEGTAFIVRGGKEGWGQPEHLKDAQGRNIVLSLYYDMKLNDYKNADRSPKGSTNPQDHCVSAMVADWDGDGDYDLLLGAKEGRLYLQRNEGKKGAPKFTGVNELLQAGDAPFNVPGGLTAARHVDWDGDGLKDLVCGSFKGGAYFYKNTGKAGAPTFAAPETLAKAGHGGPEMNWYVDVLDHDRDGDLDLLVGGVKVVQPEPRELSDEEKATLAKLDKEKKAIDDKLQKMSEEAMKEVEKLDPKERDAKLNELFGGKEMNELHEESWAIEKEIRKYRPRAKRVSGLWVYRTPGGKVAPASAKDAR